MKLLDTKVIWTIATLFGLFASLNAFLQSSSASDVFSRNLSNYQSSLSIRSMVVSPDHQRIVTTGGPWDGPGELIVWDSETGSRLALRREHTLAIWCAAFSPNGKILITGGGYGEVMVWDVSRWEIIARLDGGIPYTFKVCFSPDGKYFATAGEGPGRSGIVKLWDSTTFKELKILDKVPFSALLCSIQFTPESDGIIVIISDHSGSILVWDLTTGQQTSEVKIDSDRTVYDVWFSPSGKTFVVSLLAHNSNSFRLEYWDWTTKKKIRTIGGIDPEYAACCVVFSQDEKRIFAGCNDGIVRSWRIDAKDRFGPILYSGCSFNAICHNSISHISLIRNEKVLVAGYSQFVAAWELDNGSLVTFNRELSPSCRSLVGCSSQSALIENHFNSPRSLILSNDCTTLISAGDFGGSYGELNLWDSRDGRLIKSIKGPPYRMFMSVAMSPDRKLLITGGERGETRIKGDKVVYEDNLPNGIKIWNAATLKLVAELDSGCRFVLSVAFSNDGKYFATGGDDGRVTIWNSSSLRVHRILKVLTKETSPHAYVYSLVFSPDDRQLFAASIGSCDVQCWEVSSGKEQPSLNTGQSYGLSALCLSSSGKYLAAGSESGMILSWDWKKRIVVSRIEEHTSTITALAFSPDDKMLFSSSLDRTAYGWDLISGDRKRFSHPNAGEVRTLLLINNGGVLLTSYRLGSERRFGIWDVTSGKDGSLVPDYTKND